jgi:hypothetical protein
MARYSLQLSLATTLGALLIASGAVVDRAVLSVLFALVLLVPSLLRLSRALRAHRQPAVRSRVVATVTVA